MPVIILEGVLALVLDSLKLQTLTGVPVNRAAVAERFEQI